MGDHRNLVREVLYVSYFVDKDYNTYKGQVINEDFEVLGFQIIYSYSTSV